MTPRLSFNDDYHPSRQVRASPTCTCQDGLLIKKQDHFVTNQIMTINKPCAHIPLSLNRSFDHGSEKGVPGEEESDDHRHGDNDTSCSNDL